MNAAIERLEMPAGPAVIPPGEPTEDGLLVRALREGDGSAFEKVYRRFAPVAHGILLARVPLAEVEDLVQDVFLIVYRRIGSLRDPSAFPGWLAAIARNRAVDFHRRSTRMEELTDEDASQEPERRESRGILAAIRELPEAYREPLVLRLVEGLTGPEIAERTGLTPGSVRVNLHRGMQRLKEELRKRGIHG
ncbi:MAG: RNA polymerase sigma factor [Thermoanaerobaculia bacterium]